MGHGWVGNNYTDSEGFWRQFDFHNIFIHNGAGHGTNQEFSKLYVYWDSTSAYQMFFFHIGEGGAKQSHSSPNKVAR